MKPVIDSEFAEDLARGDSVMRKAVDKLNYITDAFAGAFPVTSIQVAGCSALEAGGRDDHVQEHLRAACKLLGNRVRDLLFDFGGALVKQRVLSAALSGRAVVETVAAIVALEDAQPLGGERDRALDELHRAIGGGRFEWFDKDGEVERLNRYSLGKEPAIPDDRRASNILTSVSKLDERLRDDSTGQGGYVRMLFAALSDFCHPATGTAILFIKPSERPGYICIRGDTGADEVRWFFWNFGLLIAPVAREGFLSLQRLAPRPGQR